MRRFVYLEQEPEHQYYGIRGQIQHIKAKVRRLNKTEENIIAAIFTPNPVDLWINIKEEPDEHLKVDKLIVNNKVIKQGISSYRVFRKKS